MGALEMLDLEALCWILEEKFCDINDCDSEHHDALWLAIGIGNVKYLKEILSAGAQVTGEHLVYAASLKNFEIVAKLAALFRYPDKLVALNLFR